MSLFKTALAKVGTSAVTVHTAPSTSDSVVIGLYLANAITTNVVVHAWVESNGTVYNLLRNATVISGQSLVVVGGDAKVVLTNGMKLVVQSNTAASIDVIMTYIEAA